MWPLFPSKQQIRLFPSFSSSAPIRSAMDWLKVWPDQVATLPASHYSRPSLARSRLSLIRELVPKAALIGVLINPQNPAFPSEAQEIEAAAGDAGQRIVLLKATNDAEINAAFADMAESHVSALIVMPDPFFNTRSNQIVAMNGATAMGRATSCARRCRGRGSAT